MKTIKARKVEAALGGKLWCGNLQYTGESAGQRRPLAGQPGRAYNSAPNWPGSKFPESNFWEVVPKLLGTRAFTHLVLLSPTSDLTNLTRVEEKYHEDMAQQSALNMFHTMVKALATTPSLKKITMFKMPPRTDSTHLSSLATTYNLTLQELVAASPYGERITVVGHPVLTTSTRREAMFGLASNPRTDGIHFRGKEGSLYLTHSIVEGLKTAGVAMSGADQPEGWRTQHRRGAASTPANTTSTQVSTSNQFAVLNC